MAQRIQMQKASGEAAVQQAMSGKQATILGIQQGQAAGASEAYQQALKNQRAANAYANQMMIKGATGIAGMAAEGDFGSFGADATDITTNSVNPFENVDFSDYQTDEFKEGFEFTTR